MIQDQITLADFEAFLAIPPDYEPLLRRQVEQLKRQTEIIFNWHDDEKVKGEPCK